MVGASTRSQSSESSAAAMRGGDQAALPTSACERGSHACSSRTVLQFVLGPCWWRRAPMTERWGACVGGALSGAGAVESARDTAVAVGISSRAVGVAVVRQPYTGGATCGSLEMWWLECSVGIRWRRAWAGAVSTMGVWAGGTGVRRGAGGQVSVGTMARRRRVTQRSVVSSPGSRSPQDMCVHVRPYRVRNA